MYGNLGDAIKNLVVFLVVSLVITFPLALWKLYDIFIWFKNHIHFGVYP
jgi:hypothetical protein